METSSILPLTESTLYILLSLSSEPRHGYSIIKDVEQLSRNSVSLSTGTLYGALKRLLDQGWIERVDDPAPDDSDRVRKHTPSPNLAVVSSMRRWRVCNRS
ncbi:MAG: PadR family transcriptional regulator [Caldilineaceae bacterium]